MKQEDIVLLHAKLYEILEKEYCLQYIAIEYGGDGFHFSDGTTIVVRVYDVRLLIDTQGMSVVDAFLQILTQKGMKKCTK